MLKTITKFVVERRRLVRQRRQQVIEEGTAVTLRGIPRSRNVRGTTAILRGIRRSSNVKGTTATPQGTPRSRRNLPSHNSANHPRPRFGAR